VTGPSATLPATRPAPPEVRPGTLPVSIAGLGARLPDRVVTNDELSQRLDTDDAWIRTRTGIRQRHVAAPDEATAALAVAAAEAALADAGLSAGDLGAVVVATTTPDHAIPGTAPTVAAALGVTAPAFDLNAACSGFVYGLRVGGALTATGMGPVLLVGAETLTRVVDPDDRDVAVLFGDGAGAAVLVADDGGALGPFDLGADGTDPTILWCEAGGTRLPVTPDLVAAGRHHLTMRGREVYRFAVATMAASAQAVLDAAGMTVADVDLAIGHQANARILEAVMNRLGVPTEKTHLTVDRHANTSAASIPLALADARDAGRLRPGDQILLTAFGAGLAWGSTLVTWTKP
jgi:3-oxoacyl-[acyl-carrier-protein] synthase III